MPLIHCSRAQTCLQGRQNFYWRTATGEILAGCPSWLTWAQGSICRGEARKLPLTGSDLPSHWFVWKLRGVERGREGKGEREGWGRPSALFPPPTGFCLKYHRACASAGVEPRFAGWKSVALTTENGINRDSVTLTFIDPHRDVTMEYSTK